MKRSFVFFLTALMALLICGCESKPDIASILQNTESTLEAQNKMLREKSSYKFIWTLDENTYIIAMMADEDDLDEIANDMSSLGEFAELGAKAYLRRLDNQTDFINVELTFIKQLIEIGLEETDIVVKACYINRDGEITVTF